MPAGTLCQCILCSPISLTAAMSMAFLSYYRIICITILRPLLIKSALNGMLLFLLQLNLKYMFFFGFLETTNSRAAWWLELRTEALTRMYNVGCDALIGYREECTIYEDVCVLSVYATAVNLNQLWVHTLPSDSSPSPTILSRKTSVQG